jgi:sugar (pentulose or hexulose) kinase
VTRGIPEGLPVIAGAADKACEVLGAGCLTPESACLSYGTAATINTCTPRYLEATRFIPPYPAALPGRYNTEIQITRGFWMVNWFKEQFGLHEEQPPARAASPPRPCSTNWSMPCRPARMGLMLQPYWNPGIKLPGPEAKGAVIGFGEVHTRAHLYRAILEGLAYALREGKERIERRGGTRIERVRVSGGGSQSDAAMQITADVFNLPTERPHLYETSGLGAAMIAAVGLGLHPDFDTAVREMTRVGQTFQPDPTHAAHLRRALPQGVLPHVPAAAAALPRDAARSPAIRPERPLRRKARRPHLGQPLRAVVEVLELDGQRTRFVQHLRHEMRQPQGVGRNLKPL